MMVVGRVGGMLRYRIHSTVEFVVVVVVMGVCVWGVCVVCVCVCVLLEEKTEWTEWTQTLKS